MGIPMTRIGLMLAVAGLVGASGTTIGGALSDIFGRKRLLVGFLAFRMLTFLILAYLVWHKYSFEVFAIVYISSAFLGTVTVRNPSA